MRARPWHLHRRWPDDANPGHTDMRKVLCRPSTTTKHTSISVRWLLQSLVVALVFSRLDYGSATLVGLPKQLIDRLQSVQNAAAWLIFRARQYDHVQPLLRSLHWLRVPERISFWLAVLVYRCLHDSAYPATWHQIFNASQTSAHVGGCACRLRQRSSPHAPCVLPLATEPSRRLLHLFGTVCRRQYAHRHHYQFSAEDWRLNSLSGLTAVLPHERLTVLTTMWPTLLLRVLAVLGLYATSS